MIEFLPQTGSTNADLLQRCRSARPVAEGHWLVADRQHKGRGRHGRAWLDAAGNFMGSTVVTVHRDDPPVTTLPLACGLAVLDSLMPLVARPDRLTLKWPNDVLLHDRKIAGILLEREGDAIVVGIGINLAAAPQVPDRGTAALGIAGPTPDRDMFARTLAATFARELLNWREGAQGTIGRWLAAAHPIGSVLSVHDEGAVRTSGRFAGLDPDGALRLTTDDGGTRIIRAGDVVLERGEA